MDWCTAVALNSMASSSKRYENPVCRSKYVEQLSKDTRRRYEDKISNINGLDPLCPQCLFTLGKSQEIVPPVDASDLVSYFVLQTSFITSQQFKARKSLEAYNQFVCGWVKEVLTWKIDSKFLITGQVSYGIIIVSDVINC